MSHAIARLGLFVVFVSLSAVAFARGNYLLGFGCGITYAFVAAAMLYLIVRRDSQGPRKTIWRRSVLGVLAIPLAYVLCFPASINPDLQYLIKDRRTDRSVRSELYAVFSSDARFADLAVSTTQQKVVIVTITGSTNNKSDLQQLRSRIHDECEHLSICVLRWDVTDRETGTNIEGLDSELFGDDRDAPDT
jgi:hypothetical protein